MAIRSLALKRPNRRGLVTNVLVTVIVAVVTNGALAAFGLNRPATERWPSFAPPGHTIGAVWVILFAGMGAARWYARSARTASAASDAGAVTGLIGLCLAYPFYTHFVSGHGTELAGNTLTLGYAVWLVAWLRTRSGLAALLVGAVALWVAFATILVFALVQLNGWA